MGMASSGFGAGGRRGTEGFDGHTPDWREPDPRLAAWALGARSLSPK